MTIQRTRRRPPIYRGGIPKAIKDKIPDWYQEALLWMMNKYPDVKFHNFDIVFSHNLNRGRYYRNKIGYKKGERPLIQIKTSIDQYGIWFYNMKSLGILQNCIQPGIKISIQLIIVHELTHHVQYERELPAGELLTTANELIYLRQLDSYWFNKLFVNGTGKVNPEAITKFEKTINKLN